MASIAAADAVRDAVRTGHHDGPIATRPQVRGPDVELGRAHVIGPEQAPLRIEGGDGGGVDQGSHGLIPAAVRTRERYQPGVAGRSRGRRRRASSRSSSKSISVHGRPAVGSGRSASPASMAWLSAASK